jgi:glutathione S-transferase
MKAIISVAFVAQWHDLESSLSIQSNAPTSIDSALDPSTPNYSSKRPTLFRERHGWCPYSERVWLALECTNTEYDTVRIDNTGPGRKPPYWGGQTPQMRWPDGKTQGESMDLVREIDERYNSGLLYPDAIKNEVINKAREFKNIFPSKSRPSSRAAFLFGWSGEPLWKSEFESVLRKTDELLSGTGGPFFCGEFTAADIAWCPFLERYAAQLPCLHDGLDPKDASAYPHLAAWYEAMETQIPAYACRVRGNPSSWRKVLMMAGFGNAGTPPAVVERIDDLGLKEGLRQTEEERARDQQLWDVYRLTRPYLADTASAEAGRVLMSNREAIVRDTLKRADSLQGAGIPLDEKGLDSAMLALACILVFGSDNDGYYNDLEMAAKKAHDVNGVYALARFLDGRMCVPRDMGMMSADAIKRLVLFGE